MTSVRKQLFLDLVNRLNLIIDQKTEQPVIKHYDLWNNQLSKDWDEPFEYPAVFFEFKPTLWKQLGKKRQEAFLDVAIHIASHTKATSSTGSQFQDKALAHLDLLDSIHFWLSGWGGDRTYHGSMQRIASNQDTFFKDVRKDIETYRVQIVDDSATKQMITTPKGELVLYLYYEQDEYITITLPNGGETLTGGETHTITWDMFLIKGDVKIELIPGEGEPISINANVEGKSYDWQIPKDFEGEYKIRITSNENPDIIDLSDNFFTIEQNQPSEFITITSPNGGESWETGEVKVISWNRNLLIDGVRIRLLDRGLPVLTIAESVTGTLYMWNIPAELSYSRNYRVEITSNINPGISDQSDSDFEIFTPKAG